MANPRNAIQRAEQEYLAEQHSPNEYEYARAPFEEEDYGRHAECEIGYNRTIQPEALMGDYPPGAPLPTQDKSRLLHPFVSWQGDVQIQVVDYNVVGPVGQGRASLKSLFALGRNDQNVYTMVPDPLAPNEFVTGRGVVAGPPPEPQFSAPNLVLGVILDWGVNLLTWAPFSFRIRCQNWFGPFGAQRLDRDITVYVDSKTSNGSSILIPFAQRLTGATVQVGPAPIPAITPAGLGAMSMGVVQPAELGQQTIDPPSPDYSAVRVGPLPGAIAAAFSGSVRLMTAASPATALYARLEGLQTGGFNAGGAEHSHRGK